MKVLSFEDYKATGKISYVDNHVSSSRKETQAAAHQAYIKSELEEMSYVMEMSTDELVGEISLITHTGKGLRQLPEDAIAAELSQRLIAIEYILLVYTKNKLNE
jgi:hypothetical protein